MLFDIGFIKPVVPAGYEIAGEEKNEDSYQIEYIMGDKYIEYRQLTSIEDIALTMDAENNDFKEIEIYGHKGYLM